jgi:hypothetical protein
LDTGRIAWVPMANRTFFDVDATEPGFDWVQRRILGEYTLEVKNADTAHAMLINLDPTP